MTTKTINKGKLEKPKQGTQKIIFEPKLKCRCGKVITNIFKQGTTIRADCYWCGSSYSVSMLEAESLEKTKEALRALTTPVTIGWKNKFKWLKHVPNYFSAGVTIHWTNIERSMKFKLGWRTLLLVIRDDYFHSTFKYYK